MSYELEQEKRERKNEEAESYFQELVIYSPVSFYGFNDNLEYTFVNIQAAKLVNKSVEELVGKKITDLFPGIEHTIFYETYLEVLRSGISDTVVNEYSLPGDEHRKVWYEVKVVPYKKGIFCITTDITDRVNMENELKEHEELFRALTENTSDITMIIDREGNYKYMNPAFQRIFGYLDEELLERNVRDFLHPDDKIQLFNTIKHSIDFPHKTNKLDTFRIRSKDGSWSYLEGYMTSLLDVPGISGIVANFRDVSENKKVEKKLKRSENKFRELFNNMSSGVAVYKAINNGEDFIFLDFNLAGEKMEKVKKEDLVGKSVLKAFPRIKEFGLFKVFQRVWKTGNPEFHPISFYEDERISGWRENYVYKLHSGEIVAVYDNITERKKAEEELMESEKNYRKAFERVEFYKDLFIHDISNILQNVKSSLGLLSLWQDKPEELNNINEIMKIINESVIRGSKLVSNIRTLSKITGTEGILKVVDIIQILKNSIKFIKKSFPDKNIIIEVENQFKIISVKADELLLDVFENILINAVNYNKNPKIEILIKLSKYGKDGINYIKIEFIDNGIGIPDIMKERIFGGISYRRQKIQGMGLGLLLVKNLITIYNGEFWVEDKIQGDPLKGSNFIITILEEI